MTIEKDFGITSEEEATPTIREIQGNLQNDYASESQAITQDLGLESPTETYQLQTAETNKTLFSKSSFSNYLIPIAMILVLSFISKRRNPQETPNKSLVIGDEVKVQGILGRITRIEDTIVHVDITPGYSASTIIQVEKPYIIPIIRVVKNKDETK